MAAINSPVNKSLLLSELGVDQLELIPRSLANVSPLRGLLPLGGREGRRKNSDQYGETIMRFFSRSFFILQILAGTVLVQTATAQQVAPVINGGTPDAIPGQYIVVFQPGTSRDFVLAAQRTAGQLGGTIGFNYTSALLGFSARLSLDA